MSSEERLISLILDAVKVRASVTLVFSKTQGSAPKRQRAHLCKKDNELIFSFQEEYEYGRVAQRNVSLTEIEAELNSLIPLYSQINVIYKGKSAEFKRSKKGKTVLTGDTALRSSLTGEDEPPDLNRNKDYFLHGDELFLYHLGISDKNGRVHDKKQGKFRQINHFIEHIENVMYALPNDEITVYDLCCGKSYLSFAVYYYLTACKGMKTSMLCIDQRSEVIDYCSEIARACGFTGMSFICDDVRKTPSDMHPNLLISLHACDIATDIVLDTAIALRSDVILSTPCCHRYLNDKINSESLSFVTKHPHLRGKLCEALTDAIRAARLRAGGYSVTACELTDPENTPKNTLLRAVINKGFNLNSEKAKKLRSEYESILSFVVGEKSKDYLQEIK